MENLSSFLACYLLEPFKNVQSYAKDSLNWLCPIPVYFSEYFKVRPDLHKLLDYQYYYLKLLESSFKPSC